MSDWIVSRLVCPVCRHALAEAAGALRCRECGASFPYSGGVPCLFRPGAEDLWAENQSGLAQLFDRAPELAEQLELHPEKDLNGADTYAKSGLRQKQGDYPEAIRLERAGWEKCYPAAYKESFLAHLDFIAHSLRDHGDPVVDVASGRGMLLSHLMERIRAPLIATDLSPSVLRNGLGVRWAEQVKSGRLALLAFDAAAAPFPDRSLPVVATCLGLQNIPSPTHAVKELRRVCGGILYALCFFFPEDDRENHEAAANYGLQGAYSRRRLTEMLEGCGWKVSGFETPPFAMPPTPVGEIVPGFRVDGLPVAETRAQFVTLVCE